MSRMTPEAEARRALDYNVSRGSLSMAAQLEYDRLVQEGYAAGSQQQQPQQVPSVPARSSPEVRVRILQMFKRINYKYAKPFEQGRLSYVSVLGGDWEEYGQIVLQMAILDTLLSIEEKLSTAPAPGQDPDQPPRR